MKEKFLDPFLANPQFKVKFKDGWGTNAMCLKGNPPAWLKDVKITALKKVSILNKAASKATVKEVADFFTANGHYTILDEDIQELYGTMGTKAGNWVRVGHVMIQKRYWDFFDKDYDCVLVPTAEHFDPIVVFYKDGDPVSVFIGVEGTYKQFKVISEFLDEKLEVSR